MICMLKFEKHCSRPVSCKLERTLGSPGEFLKYWFNCWLWPGTRICNYSPGSSKFAAKVGSTNLKIDCSTPTPAYLTTFSKFIPQVLGLEQWTSLGDHDSIHHSITMNTNQSLHYHFHTQQSTHINANSAKMRRLPIPPGQIFPLTIN